MFGERIKMIIYIEEQVVIFIKLVVLRFPPTVKLATKVSIFNSYNSEV